MEANKSLRSDDVNIYQGPSVPQFSKGPTIHFVWPHISNLPKIHYVTFTRIKYHLLLLGPPVWSKSFCSLIPPTSSTAPTIFVSLNAYITYIDPKALMYVISKNCCCTDPSGTSRGTGFQSQNHHPLPLIT